MVGVGRHLCGSSSPAPLPKQGHPEQAAQDRVQEGLEYLRRRRIHNLSGQPVPVLNYPQREEVLPHLQLELPMLQFVSVAPCPVVGHRWKESGPILLTPTSNSHRQFPTEEEVGFPSFLFWTLDDTCILVLVSSYAFSLMHDMGAYGTIKPTKHSNPSIGCKNPKGPGKLSGDNSENLYDIFLKGR